jgi:hypothetical protein
VDWETTGADVEESGGRKLNQSGDAGTSSLALEDDAVELLGISGERKRNRRFFSSDSRRIRPPLTKTFASAQFFFQFPFNLQ